MIMATGIMARQPSLGPQLRRQAPRLRHAATRPWGLTARCNQANWLTMPSDAAFSMDTTNLNPPSRKSLTQII